MDKETVPFCGKHRMSREWRPTVFEYDADGVSLKVPNVHAWVCPEDGDAYFVPETVSELNDRVRELIERKRGSLPPESTGSID